jgi:hypothetical protein
MHSCVRVWICSLGQDRRGVRVRPRPGFAASLGSCRSGRSWCPKTSPTPVSGVLSEPRPDAHASAVLPHTQTNLRTAWSCGVSLWVGAELLRPLHARAGIISAAEVVYCPDGGAQAKAFIAAVVSARASRCWTRRASRCSWRCAPRPPAPPMPLLPILLPSFVAHPLESIQRQAKDLAPDVVLLNTRRSSFGSP